MRLDGRGSLESRSPGLSLEAMQVITSSTAVAWRSRGLAALLALAAAGCEGSGRFTRFRRPAGRRAAAAPRPDLHAGADGARRDERLAAARGTQPLPPPVGANPELDGLPSRPEGASPSAPPSPGLPSSAGLPPAGGSVPIDPDPVRPAQRPTEPPPVAEPPTRVASRPDPARPRPPRRRAPT